jgi:hypothetical protein
MGVAEHDDRCAGALAQGGTPVELRGPRIITARVHLLRVGEVVAVAQ